MPGLVLIVDEDELERRYISALLAADGFDVMQVEQAIEGMVAITALEPSLVILAPGPRLSEEARRVRIPQLVRVFRRITNAPLAIIGDPQPSDEIDSLVSGGDLYIPRTFGASELISRCRMLVRRKGDATASASDFSGESDVFERALNFAQTTNAILEILNRSEPVDGREAA